MFAPVVKGLFLNNIYIYLKDKWISCKFLAEHFGTNISIFVLGDKIIIASTDYDWKQAEEKTIMNCGDLCAPNQVRLWGR